MVAIYYFVPFHRGRPEGPESDAEDESVSRLRTLNHLLAEGLIDREEYERKRLEVLETL